MLTRRLMIGVNPMRICPRCTKVLEQQVVEGVTIEGCHGCGGAWFDHGELDEIAKHDHAALARIDQAFVPARAERPAAYSSMRCPVCLDRLDKFEFKHFPGIELEGCRKCRGVWADHGHLAEIAERIAKIKEHR
jgi:Zn-finger nucleic acid-binding protein